MTPPEIFQRLDFVFGKRVPMIHQSEAAECGLACLAMVSSYHGFRTDLNAMRQRASLSLKGATLKSIIAVAETLGLVCRPLRVELSHVARLKLPAILHWDLSHFVVLTRVRGKTFWVNDPAMGERSFTIDEISRHFTGVAVELTRTSGYNKKNETRRIRIRDVIGKPKGLLAVLVQVFVLSVILQLIAIAAPFYQQLVIDEVLTRFDADLLPTLAVGFALLKVISIVTTGLRSYIQLYLGNMLTYQMEVNLFNHLIRLPLPFFEKRHIGDIVSRFGSTDPIQNMLTHGLVGTFVDGFLAVSTGVLIYYYSVTLGAVVTIALVIYVLYRLFRYSYFRLQSLQLIQAKAKENTNFLENIRAIRPIKIFGREAQRQNIWQNYYADILNMSFKVGKLNIYFSSVSDLLFGVESILVIYLAARMILQGTFTVGMLFAFLSYREFFVSRSLSLVQTAIDFKMLDIHLDRLADIGLTPKEKGLDTPVVGRPITGAIALQDVSFRYADTEPYIFEGLNFSAAPGECVAITGPSGCGKTTMMKVMLGLLPLPRGHVLVDGVPLSNIGLPTFRRQVAAVMQDDQLMSGTLADNIAFFDPEMDLDWVQECARIAAIHDDVMRMPMGYNSLCGDMGTVLSGGQKQRVLLARALYAKPRILLLDEGTAHLDLHTEKVVSDAIAQLKMTRIIIAHRPQTIMSADRIVVMDRGQIAPVRFDGYSLVPAP